MFLKNGGDDVCAREGGANTYASAAHSFLEIPPPQKNKNEERQGERAGRAVLRAWRDSESRHAIGAYERVPSHHALGACEVSRDFC